MDRRTTHWAVCNSSVQTPWNPSLELLLQTGANKCLRAMVNAAGRRDLHGLVLLWLAQNCSRAKEGMPHCQPQTCAKDHEAIRPGKQSARTQHLKAASRTCQVPLFAEGNDPTGASRSMEHRYHLHSTSSGVCVPRSCNRLVQSLCAFFSPVQQSGDELLPRRFRRSNQPLRLPKNLQYRSRSAIYLRGLCESCARQKHLVQHGWERSSFGQYFCRTPMEIFEV